MMKFLSGSSSPTSGSRALGLAGFQQEYIRPLYLTQFLITIAVQNIVVHNNLNNIFRLSLHQKFIWFL